MQPMIPMSLFSLYQAELPEQKSLTSYAWRFLALGDSWFGPDNFSLLNALTFPHAAGVLNCARPGPELRHVVQIQRETAVKNLLYGKQARAWSGILLSIGGNDLINAMRVAPLGRALNNQALRLLCKQEEWGDISLGPLRYVSAAGWNTFEKYLRANVEDLLRLRDHDNSLSQHTPVFVHTYAVPTPRNAGHNNAPAWLYPAVKLYGVPLTDWVGLSELLFTKLGQVLKDMAADTQRYPHLHVFDSLALPDIERAGLGETGTSGDWKNEIHLNENGCKKLGKAWSEAISRVLTP